MNDPAQNKAVHTGGREFLLTWCFTDEPDGPGKDFDILELFPHVH
jgi:hypothetical protein